jgi:hypothetical protein
MVEVLQRSYAIGVFLKDSTQYTGHASFVNKFFTIVIRFEAIVDFLFFSFFFKWIYIFKISYKGKYVN